VKLPRSISPIGLDISGTTVACAQLARRRGQWRIENAALIPRPAGAAPESLRAEESIRLADILSRQGFLGSEVATAVPDSKLMASVLELPPRSSGAPVDELARSEMARTHKREPGSFEMACWDLPAPTRGSDATHMMAAAYAHEEAHALIDALEAGGLRAIALDMRAWAMARLCERHLSGSTNVAAMVDLGETGAVLVLLRAGVVVYERVLAEACLSGLRTRIAAKLGVGPEVSDPFFSALLQSPAGDGDEGAAEVSGLLEEHAQGLARELRTALTYAVHRYGGEVQCVMLHGVGATLRGLAERMSSEVGAPAMAANPAELVPCSPGVAPVCCNPALAVAVGLARHGLERAA
jgi:type IV pilus assembly protein PilM